MVLSYREVKGLAQLSEDAQRKGGSFTLSKSGKNVVVLVLDRAVGVHIPYIFHEKPELREIYSGFTWYSNTLSHGKNTITGNPSMFGGYEYTPFEINKRSDETMKSKQNEALKVMPVVFAEEGYEVTVFDPIYANYEWIADTSIYDDYLGIKAYNLAGRFSDREFQEKYHGQWARMSYLDSIFYTLPGVIRPVVISSEVLMGTTKYRGYGRQMMKGLLKSEGFSKNFLDSYNVLDNFDRLTNISQDNQDTFLMMVNDTSHEYSYLQLPNYVPRQNVDNTLYEESIPVRYDGNGNKIILDNSEKVSSYHSAMAAYIKVGEWIEFLKANDVYDNTRIIIVSDHGFDLRLCEDMYYGKDEGNSFDAEYFNPILLVKDFHSQGFHFSDEFMTNADVPALAVEGLVDRPVNPFTNKPINNEAKNPSVEYAFFSNEWEIQQHLSRTFPSGTWYSVSDDVRKKENWKLLQQNSISPLEQIP